MNDHELILKIYDHVVVMNSEQGIQAVEIARLNTKIDMFEKYMFALVIAVIIGVITNVILSFLKKKQIC